MNILAVFVCALLPASALPCAAQSHAKDSRSTCATSLVVEWNELVFAAAEAEDGFLTLKGVRTAAMMHIAMHDAINAIHRHYAGYVFRGDGSDADPTIAAVQAAYEVAVSQYPQHAPRWNRQLSKSLRRSGDDSRRLRSVDLGREAARAILKAREADNWNGEGDYKFQPAAPGIYAEFPEHSGTAPGFVFGAGWATAAPFTLNRVDQFRVSPPPATSGARYAAAFTEVKELGSFASRSRTKDQTHNAHRHTYPFPSYPSAHGTACAAGMTVLEDTFGDAYAFTMITREVSQSGPASPKIHMHPTSRSFRSFSDAAMECALSRVYLGIHFRYDSVAGNTLGRAIGAHAVKQFLAPVH